MKKKILYVLLGLTVYTFMFSVVYVVSNQDRYHYTDCGILEHKSTASGNCDNLKYYFSVRFEHRGFEDLEVTEKDYTSHKEKDKVCYKFSKKTEDLDSFDFFMQVSNCLFLIIVFIGFMLLIMGG